LSSAAGLWATNTCTSQHVLFAASHSSEKEIHKSSLCFGLRMSQVAAAGREAALLQQQLAASAAEAAGLHTALQEAQDRYAHQLAK
jgi:hypothetical protein